MSATSAAASVSVVLVHGGFVDGSGWQGVYNILQQHGYRVSIVQNPTISLDDDVAVTKRVIAAQPGPVVLVGHSYGGVVITQAGNHLRVAALVYVSAFAPDIGESTAEAQKHHPPPLLLLGSGTQRFMAHNARHPHGVRPWRPHLPRLALPARLRPSAALEQLEFAAIGAVRAQMGAQSCRPQWAAHLSRFPVGTRPRKLRRPVVTAVRRASSAAAGDADRSTRSVMGLDRERAKRATRRINASRALGA
jgi:pimeloyl-ACP methyl ester carboxylesterase